MKKKTKVYEFKCGCCGDTIDQDNYEDAWTDDKTIFCSMECVARWHGSEISDQMLDGWDEFVEENIMFAVPKKTRVRGHYQKINGKRKWIKPYMR